MRRLTLLILTVWYSSCGKAAAEEPVIAVFSAQTGPYQEAFSGLEQEFTAGVQPFFLSRGEPDIPSSTRIVLVFGSKAVLRKYPKGITLIYAMAPGTTLEDHRAIKISMMPEVSVLIAELRKIQPGLKKLGVLWKSPNFEDYVRRLHDQGMHSGLTVEGVFLMSVADIPDRLRVLYGKVDALWLPPDPLLITGESLPIFMAFSKSNRIPLFAPTRGLVKQGALAFVGPSFHDMGLMAASVARDALEGRSSEHEIYPIHVSIVINQAVASQMGLKLSEDILKKAETIIP